MKQNKVDRSLSIEKKMVNYPQIAPHPYLSLQAGRGAVRVGIWTATATQLVENDWSYYPRSCRYAKTTISDRRITFISDGGKATIVDIGGWRGNWRLSALVSARIVRPRIGLLNVRLNAVFDLELLCTRLDHKFYRRSLKGQPVDYCIVSPAGMTYHAGSIGECIQGLRLKQAAFERRNEWHKTAIIDWELLRKLGFCPRGIAEFCDAFGFDSKDRVTPQQVYDRVREDLAAAAPYLSELKQLAAAVCFKIPELN